jgi:hypothetical protein
MLTTSHTTITAGTHHSTTTIAIWVALRRSIHRLPVTSVLLLLLLVQSG